MPVQQACPPDHFLDSFALGLLTPPEVETWAGHVEQCDKCTAHMIKASTVKDMITDALKKPGNAKKEREHPRVKSLIAEVSGWGRQEEKTGPSPRKEAMDFLAPSQGPGELGRLGNYRVLELLGIGGMGMVFKAEDLSLKRIVALKAMKPALAATADYRGRFQREAQAAALVEHDNIVPIYQVGEDRGIPYLAMPLLNGESLDALLKRSGKLEIRQIVQLGCQMAQGLQAAHDRGLIHRDIKPANIWIEPAQGGRVRILDFGLARSMGDDASRLTLSGTVLGTPAYMAPEQANDEPLDHRSDLFSLGCILYQMCTGYLPFDGKSTIGILASLANQTPVLPEKLNPKVPRLLSQLIMKLLAKDPHHRISSATEVARVLQSIQGVSAIYPIQAPQTSSSHRWRILLAGVVLVLAMLVIGGAVYQFYYRTENGTLVLEVDKEADVRFQAGELRIHDPSGKLLYTLKPSEKNKTLPPGKYTVDVIGADGVKLETDKFEIVKNGEVKLRVTMDKYAVKPNPGSFPSKNITWDFTTGDRLGTTSEETELIDGKVWKMNGGQHLRFKSPGTSWLEATFELPSVTQPSGDKRALWKLEAYHIVSGTASNTPGYAPVRILLNGRIVWEGQPQGAGNPLVPGGVQWKRLEQDVTAFLRPGTNVIRWEYLKEASTHYWLKSFRVFLASPDDNGSKVPVK